MLKLLLRNLRRETMRLARQDKRWERFSPLMVVHDEVLLEVPKSIAYEAAALVRRTMESVVKMKIQIRGKEEVIPIEAEVCLVPSWGLSKLDPEDRVEVFRKEMCWSERRIRWWFPEGMPAAS